MDALSLKDVQLGLENGQFTAKKPTSGKSYLGHSSQGCLIVWFHEKEISFAMSKPTVLFIFCIL